MNKIRRRKQRARRAAAAEAWRNFRDWWIAGMPERMRDAAHRNQVAERRRTLIEGLSRARLPAA